MKSQSRVDLPPRASLSLKVCDKNTNSSKNPYSEDQDSSDMSCEKKCHAGSRTDFNWLYQKKKSSNNMMKLGSLKMKHSNMSGCSGTRSKDDPVAVKQASQQSLGKTVPAEMLQKLVNKQGKNFACLPFERIDTMKLKQTQEESLNLIKSGSKFGGRGKSKSKIEQQVRDGLAQPLDASLETTILTDTNEEKICKFHSMEVICMGQVFEVHPAVMSKLVMLSKESIAWQIMKNLTFQQSQEQQGLKIVVDEVAIALAINQIMQPDIRQTIGTVIEGPSIVVEMDTYNVQIRMPYLRLHSTCEPNHDNNNTTSDFSLPLETLCDMMSDSFKRFPEIVQENWLMISQFSQEQQHAVCSEVYLKKHFSESLLVNVFHMSMVHPSELSLWIGDTMQATFYPSAKQNIQFLKVSDEPQEIVREIANNCVVQFYEPLANWAIHICGEEIMMGVGKELKHEEEESKEVAGKVDTDLTATASGDQPKANETTTSTGLAHSPQWEMHPYMVPIELKNFDGSCAGPARIEFLPPLEFSLDQHILSTKGTVAEEESVSEESDEEEGQVNGGANCQIPKSDVTYATSESTCINFTYGNKIN